MTFDLIVVSLNAHQTPLAVLYTRWQPALCRRSSSFVGLVRKLALRLSSRYIRSRLVLLSVPGTHVVTSVRLGGVRVSVAVVKPHLLAELRRLRLAPVDVASIISLQLSNRTHEGVFVSSLPNPSSLVVSNRTVDLGSLSSLVKWRNADQTKPFLSSSLAVTRVGLQPITEVMSQIATPVPPRFLDFVQSGYCNVLSACSLFYPVWPNAGGDTRASGTSVWSVDVTSRLAVLWLSPESEKVLVTCGPIVVDSSAIAAGTAGGSLIALYRDSGNLLWTLHTGTGCKVVDARYVHNSNQLVVGTACGNLIAFDYWSHTVMWNVTLGASLATTPVHTADGSIWCAVEGSVVNVSPTGGISWSYQLTNDSVSSNIVAFTDGTITAGLTSGGLLSLKSRHARTTPLDSFRPVVHVCVSPLNTVIASDSAGYMFAVSGYSGKLLWRSAGPFTSPPSVFRDVVVVGSPEGLAALFVTNGTVAWQVAWTSQTRVQPTVSVTGHVVVALDDSSVAVVNASTGSFVWKSTLDNSLNLTSPVVIHADGTLYGVSSNQTLVSFAV
jgi:outer membrane protein assembly factor BamB